MRIPRFRRMAVVAVTGLLLHLISFASQAQYVTFSQATAIATLNGQYSAVIPYAIAVDQAGNTYLTGRFYDSVTLGTTTLHHTKGRIFVAKRDPGGNYLWVAQAGGGQQEAAEDIAVDAAGNVYITGYFYNTNAYFGSIQVQDQTGLNGFAAKLSPTGTWLWAVRGGGKAAVRPMALALDNQADIYITGHFEGNQATFGSSTLVNLSTDASDRDAFVTKLSSTGQWLWAVGIGGNDDEEGRDIAVDADNKIHVVGSFTSATLDVGTDRLTNFGSDNMFVAELNDQGVPQWANSGGGNNQDQGATLAVDGQGNTYVAGRFFSAVAHFGSTDIYKVGLTEIFVGKLDRFGEWIWAKRAGGTGSDQPTGIAVDARGDVYVTGSHASPYFTAGLLGLPQTGELDAYVFKLASATGDCLWLTGGGGMFNDVGNAIALDRTGKVYVTGTFEQEADFGLSHLTYPSLYGSGYVAQINSTSLPLATNAKNIIQPFTVYPNPSTGTLTVAGLNDKTEVLLYDLQGQLVWRSVYTASPAAQIQLPRSLRRGLYVLRIGSRSVKLSLE